MLYAAGGLVLGEAVSLWRAALEERGKAAGADFLTAAAWLAVFIACFAAFFGSRSLFRRRRGSADREREGVACWFCGLWERGLHAFQRMRDLKNPRRTFLLCFPAAALFFTCFFTGMLRMELETGRFVREERTVGALEGKECSVVGTVGSVEERASGVRLELKDVRLFLGDFQGNGPDAKKARPGDPADPAGEVRRVYAYLDDDAGLRIGMDVLVSGEISAAKGARNPGGFDFRTYCRSKGICGSVFGEKVRILDKEYLAGAEFLRQLRGRLAGFLGIAFDEEDAGLLKAVLLGDRNDMEESVYELYRKNGISHLLAISGLHVSLIGMGIWGLLRKCRCSLAEAAGLSGVFLLLYGAMTGFGPSVARAVSMMLLSFLAAVLGRTYDLPSAMCVPAIILLLGRPYVLTQASFQLSFLAVGAVFFPGRFLIRQFHANGLFQSFLVSSSIQLVTAPAILYHSFEFPVYSVFLNLLVIPLMSLVVVSGMLAMAAAAVWPQAGVFFAGGAHYILALYKLLCEMTGRLPCANVIVGRPSAGQIVLYAVCALAGILAVGTACSQQFLGSRPERWERIPAAGTACDGSESEVRNAHGVKARRILSPGRLAMGTVFLSAGVLCLLPAPVSGLRTVFLDVGQGDGIVLREGRKTVLVDCGSSQEKSLGEEFLVPYLKSQGISEIRSVIVTHGDQDHINGIRYLLKHEETGIAVKRLVLPVTAAEDEACGELAELALGRGIRTEYVACGAALEAFSGSGKLVCVYPFADTKTSDRNEGSLVCLASYGQFSMLLTGDLGAEGERALLEQGGLRNVTVLKAGHHGSATSTGKEFLDALRPRVVVLSYGAGNRYGHPNGEVVERIEALGCEILRTEDGPAAVWTDGERLLFR